MQESTQETDAGNSIITAFYERARDELVERIRLRDNAVTIFFIGCTILVALFGQLIQSSHFEKFAWLSSGIFLAICLLSKATMLIGCQHHLMIGAIEHYLVLDFDRHIRSKGILAPQWDASRSVMELKDDIILGRAISQYELVRVTAELSLCAYVFLQLRYGPYLNGKLISSGSLVLDSIRTINFRDGIQLEDLEVIVGSVASIILLIVIILNISFAKKLISEVKKKRLDFKHQMDSYIKSVS